jgi:UDP-N-acetylmuramoyl-L-alanyl-D-glutamate--2,6-diaminopimelate ligase
MSAVMIMSSADPNTAVARVGELLDGILTARELAPVAGVAITDLTIDSREVKPGTAFIALSGTREHGLRYAAAAADKGAAIVLYEPMADIGVPALDGISCLAVPNLREELGTIADRFFGAPSARMRIAGVTGTNGKTTTAWLIAAATEQLGLASAYAGTLGVGPLNALQPRAHTTPDCVSLHRELAALRDQQARVLGMEISSHALDQSRVAGLRVDTAVFTNLTRDHLDYHGTLEAYGDAKARLFAMPGVRCAVINADDAFGSTLLAEYGNALPTIAYSRATPLAIGSQVRWLVAEHVELGVRGLTLTIGGDFGRAQLRSRLIGEFNAENLLAALGVLLFGDVELSAAVRALEEVDAPPGRMQTLVAAHQPLAVVDYAHTPDALAKALRAARAHTTGQLICVFGCGGERDNGKRPLMGEAAARLADRVIVTDDNPRGEDGARIVAQILAGMPKNEHVLVERDRARAIALALSSARAGDVVLVAGKGHEDYQIVGSERRHFSDAEVIADWMEQRA